MITFGEACERVIRYCRAIGRQESLIGLSNDFDSYWLFTYAVPSIEDKNRIFQYGSLIVEKQTGDIFFPPSRSARRIEFSDFPSRVSEFERVNAKELEELENHGIN